MDKRMEKALFKHLGKRGLGDWRDMHMGFGGVGGMGMGMSMSYNERKQSRIDKIKDFLSGVWENVYAVLSVLLIIAGYVFKCLVVSLVFVIVVDLIFKTGWTKDLALYFFE